MPLSGQRLIEASAGTGKTYNIANLYLRLVSGLGAQGPQTPLAVERILVVTFTRAAAAELRGRIRSLLERAYNDFRAGHSDHPFIANLLTAALEHQGRDQALRLFHRALLSMDDAIISTIHSFAVKAAATFVFETGTIEGGEVSLSGAEHRQARLLDVYRRLTGGDDAHSQAFFEFAYGKDRSEFLKYFGSNLPEDTRILTTGGGARPLDELRANWLALCVAHQELVSDWMQLVSTFSGNKPAAQLQELFNEQLSDQAHAIKGASNGLAGYLLRNLQHQYPAYEDKRDKGYWTQWLKHPGRCRGRQVLRAGDVRPRPGTTLAGACPGGAGQYPPGGQGGRRAAVAGPAGAG